MVVSKIYPMKSLKVLHNIKCVECLVQGCRSWVDTDVALDKHGLSWVVSCSVSFPLEPFWGVIRERGMSSILAQVYQHFSPPNLH